MDVKQIENLSKINIPENLREEVINNFAEIIEFVDKLKKVTDINEENNSNAITRKDEVCEYKENNLLANVPQTKDNYIFI